MLGISNFSWLGAYNNFISMRIDRAFFRCSSVLKSKQLQITRDQLKQQNSLDE
jgi:hypothetical protein